MNEQLEHLRQSAFRELTQAGTLEQLEAVSIRYQGRKSELNQLLRQLKDQPAEARKSLGALANAIREEISQFVARRREELASTDTPAAQLDPTVPGQRPAVGYRHPLSIFMESITDIFWSMGFDIVSGPELETSKYNFDLLNIPPEHPTRDMWDTFYVQKPGQEKVSPASPEQLVLRTHTSPVQLRVMENRRPPVRLIVPGRVFRHEATDASHESVFYQCEGLVIDRSISVANLLGTIQDFLSRLYGSDVQIRVRPEYYPFVEPGLDIEMSCLLCHGRGCSVCQQTGWIEMIGSGLVHPQVLRNMKIDPDEYSGFAFGMGVDRLMMLYYGVNDVRLSYSGDLRFVSQFI